MRFLPAALTPALALGLRADSQAQADRPRPAFTLRSLLAAHREDGEKVVLDDVCHASSNGDFRLVTTRADKERASC